LHLAGGLLFGDLVTSAITILPDERPSAPKATPNHNKITRWIQAEKESAGELWDHVVGLARFPGFSELKRSLRERPQLVGFGVPASTTGQQEDWHAGSRRQKK
jgi:hypothetical protein